MSSPVLLALAALVAVVSMLVLGLRALAAAGRRMQQPATADSESADETPEHIPAALAAGPGYLSDDEKAAAEWCATTTKADLDRLEMVERVVLHRIRSTVEDAIRQLLTPDQRSWIRVHTGEFDLVGVA